MTEQDDSLSAIAGADAAAEEARARRGRYLPSEERRNQAIDAVIALAGQENPAEISTGDVARRMQLTQGALFRQIGRSLTNKFTLRHNGCHGDILFYSPIAVVPPFGNALPAGRHIPH